MVDLNKGFPITLETRKNELNHPPPTIIPISSTNIYDNSKDHSQHIMVRQVTWKG